MIRIPKKFYDDHADRELPAPEVIKETKAHYFINAYPSDYLAELLSDARHHATFPFSGWSDPGEMLGIVSSARATVKAIEGR